MALVLTRKQFQRRSGSKVTKQQHAVCSMAEAAYRSMGRRVSTASGPPQS